MKRLALIFAALCVCLTISCNKEVADSEVDVTTPEATMQTITITATMADTKTAYTVDPSDDTKLVFSWTAGDEISVKCTDGNFYTFTANSNGATTTFTGSIPSGYALDSKAYFPADAGHTSGNFSLPSYKDISGHDSADIPMLGTKGTGNDYSFVHCAGAALLTIINIPDGITSVTITVESAHATDPSHCIKLSGSFWINDAGTSAPYWSGAYAATDSEKQFSRKVTVSDHSAKLYVPCPGGYNNGVPNKLTVIGHSSGGNITLVDEKPMKKLGQVNRAHVLPLTPLPLSNLSRINWSDAGVATSTLDPSDSRKCLTELKVYSDQYYMYARLKGPKDVYSGNYLDVYLSDGNGENYSLANDNKYWSTGGDVIYCQEHKGNITLSSISMTFNGVGIDTDTDDDGESAYWLLAFPRSAHSLLSSAGTVYVGFALWNSWSITGVIPTKFSSMLSVTLP